MRCFCFSDFNAELSTYAIFCFLDNNFTQTYFFPKGSFVTLFSYLIVTWRTGVFLRFHTMFTMIGLNLGLQVTIFITDKFADYLVYKT